MKNKSGRKIMVKVLKFTAFVAIMALLIMNGLAKAAEYENIAPGNTATGITATVRRPTSGPHAGQRAVSAMVTVESNTVNFTYDGSTPTAAAGTNLGHQMAAGQSFMLNTGEQVNNFLVIDRVSGSTSLVKVTCEF